jgi:hypothetical protein
VNLAACSYSWLGTLNNSHTPQMPWFQCAFELLVLFLGGLRINAGYVLLLCCNFMLFHVFIPTENLLFCLSAAGWLNTTLCSLYGLLARSQSDWPLSFSSFSPGERGLVLSSDGSNKTTRRGIKGNEGRLNLLGSL